MHTYYPIVSDQIEGFEVELMFEDEIYSPEELLEDRQDIEDINNGVYEWCIACVRVYKAGIMLSESNIGGCAYKHGTLVKDFKESGYYEDMVRDGIFEARQAISKLNES